MAGAASPSPQRHLDTADEFQSSSPTTDAQRRGRPPFQGTLARPLRIQAPWCLQGMFRLALQVDRTCPGNFHFSASLQPQKPGHVSSGPTRSRSRTPTISNSKKPTLSWADKARGRRESPRGDASNRGSPHASELDEMRRANEQLRKENAQLKQEMSRLAAEVAEIRKLASSPPLAQPATPTPVAMDTSEALRRPSGTKRRAVENTQEEEAVNLLSELKVSFVNMQATLAKIQEAVAHPKMGLGALSERISKLEEVDARRDPGPTPLQAFQLLLDRARRNRDVSGQPASFQYTLWCMVLLVVFVTAVGVVLLSSAAQRQRDKLTSTTEPATTNKPDDEDNHEDNDYEVSVEQHISGQEVNQLHY
ncbi:hypothetical protein MRX96_026628 [Rhipicephalus microplus]